MIATRCRRLSTTAAEIDNRTIACTALIGRRLSTTAAQIDRVTIDIIIAIDQLTINVTAITVASHITFFTIVFDAISAVGRSAGAATGIGSGIAVERTIIAFFDASIRP